MLIIDDTFEKSIKINMTLEELWLLCKWMDYNKLNSAQVNILRNGCDMYDYYAIEIILETNNEKNKLVSFIRSLTQESNFGGIRKNEYWIDEQNILN